MLKDRGVAKVFESIVGPDNFSEDPAIVSSYTFQTTAHMGADLLKDMYDLVKMGAVIMPGSTEEVQAIVRVCNRYRINYKAFSTGLGPWGTPMKEGSLQIDLRRMDRIIKLDDKNMYAVVEPYVSNRALMVEAMKKGLVCHVGGAGSQTSALAATTALAGNGHSATTTGIGGRNCLGVEWVLPTGDVVRWGLVEEGKTGHPGPGLWGVARGERGSVGGLGVFTKCAAKLFPWYGPAQLETTGKYPTPGYRIPDNFKVHLLAFPSREARAEATYKLTDAEVAYHVWYHPLFMHVQRWMSESNDDHYEIWKKLQTAGVVGRSLNEMTVVIGAYSEQELQYKEKVVKDIIEETGAETLIPDFMTEHDIERFFCAQIAVHKPCTEFRLGGGDMGNGVFQFMHFDNHVKMWKKMYELQKQYVDRGVLTDLGGESGWGGPLEQKAVGHTEYPNFTNPRDPELVRGQSRFIAEGMEFAVRERLLGTGGVADSFAHEHLGDYVVYQKRIKETLDPNDVADPYGYFTVASERIESS